MVTITCHDCDSHGDGNCSVCHGTGKTLDEGLLGTIVEFFHLSRCSACRGTGHCRTCGGIGQIEIGGEGG
jgi:DnaJ-class molecular chaperone